MKFTRLGRSGLEISRLCIGCMSFGDPGRGSAWMLDEERSRPLLKKALDVGINFFDTANVYAAGASEEILGRFVAAYAPRDEIVIASKVQGRMRAGPNGGGLSRKAIFAEIDHSLRRLGVDHIDLYQIHRLDPDTPIEETLQALHDLVTAGKVRYLGASSMFAWQLARALARCDSRGLHRFVSMQSLVNLLYREEEREMLPLCRQEGVGVIAWSPLARGRLARPWGTPTQRSQTDAYGERLFAASEEADHRVMQAVVQVAGARGVPPAQVALAWVLQHPSVTAPLIGATRAQHLDDAVAALSLSLTPDEIASLEAPYVPHAVVGFS